MPSFRAFCLNEPSERFINFASFDTGVLAFECIFNSLISDAVYSLRLIFFFAAFLATSISNLIRSGLITRSHSSSSELMRTDDHENLLILSLDHEPLPVSYVHRRVRFYWINALRVLNSSTALA